MDVTGAGASASASAGPAQATAEAASSTGGVGAAAAAAAARRKWKNSADGDEGEYGGEGYANYGLLQGQSPSRDNSTYHYHSPRSFQRRRMFW